MIRRLVAVLLCASLLPVAVAQRSDAPVRVEDGRLLVDGKPFVILGGELGNSSAGTAAQADTILPAMARLHVNTILMPVAWEQVEPVEGTYDFTILDHWIAVAQQQKMHLVLLWFGSWKNAFSEYAPGWVKADTKRFPRAMSAEGEPTEVLSTFGAETLRLDSRAFGRVMAHVRERDAQHVVLMVQVENEVGFPGMGGRDRSPEANREFAGRAPRELIEKLAAQREPLAPELAAHFNAKGTTWREVFGDAADEAFMAWRYATYIDQVAAAGKREDPLPFYMNAQLPAFLERAGDYPSGGPHPGNLDIYRAVADHIDFYAPDIYWPEFESWVQRYQRAGNPAFIPEARLEVGPYNALSAYGAARAFGFSPFGIDSMQPAKPGEAEPLIAQVYGALESLGGSLAEAQAQNRTRGVVLHASSARGTQVVALGGYLFQASLSRAWGTNALQTNDGAMLVLESGQDEFLVIGTGLTVKFARDPDADSRVAGIASIEAVSRDGSDWKVVERLNGDQSNQGRQLSMDGHAVRMYRVKLYAAER